MLGQLETKSLFLEKELMKTLNERSPWPKFQNLIEFYSLRSEEVLSIESISNPVTIRFKSNIENYIHFYDIFSGKEFFIFEDSLNSQSNTFTEQWDG